MYIIQDDPGKLENNIHALTYCFCGYNAIQLINFSISNGPQHLRYIAVEASNIFPQHTVIFLEMSPINKHKI